MYPSFFSTALIQVEDKIKVGNDAVMKYMNDNGYPLSGTLKENIETIKNYGESTGVESTVEVRDYIMKKLVEGGYEWIE